ncbi:hypothetical protein [Thermofilum pendens]|uniref:Uncharacterized protein n=1 Tax=Thermofilum pendens (strain DSM 2475 / Hrk 5) TaxID=368408 RepID=A1RZI8_THEPD|nr:hypothetical protein [Thermofilum pendens]ABL78618.1 hypothetical protein Tpen_1220 [Thermofilum pendens Hrk 5]
MKEDEAVAAGEAGAEFDEEFVRGKLRELLRKALFHRYNYRGLEATHNKVMWELINIKANYARYGEAYVELVNKFEVGKEKAFRIARKVAKEALERIDELEIKRTGKTTWQVKLPGERWRVYIYLKPSGKWCVEIRLYIKVAKLRLPDILKLPPEWLRIAQEGWVFGDATYRARYREIAMTTSQAWQVASFPGFWPGKEVEVHIKSIAIHEKRHVSIMWTVKVKGVCNVPRVWSFPKVVKQRIIVDEIEKANEGEIDEQRALKLALLYAADGEYPGSNSARRVLEFAVGRRSRWIRTEQSVRLAKLLLEKAPQVVAFLCASGCRKAQYLARLALVESRKPRAARQQHGFYAPIAGAMLNLVIVTTGDEYAYIYARMPVSNAPQGWYERAVEEGWTVNVVRNAGTLYYEVPQDSLFEHASEDPELWEALYSFALAKAQAKPAAKKLVEKLLRIKPARAQE